ncbi:GDSL-type esterase/lipase family protein [Oscillatoria salina]|uniref:GDSL-type esterase/lipase family protein n=1 Tax=Oscillatoria salina TaxID=331517 RepID=UPI0013BDCC73|nr:GDSL-type esterase/lipase family protein [Oscillatoria salina]MBZ8179947.1 G-D-S-L family lipolytic protein [Oscillatoria salina IIICB1]NET86828.1 G-D-S-L family lipolytic protein [Kamptonema sp. SIO1D9]
MKRILVISLLISLTFNCLFTLLGGIFLAKRGGLPYLFDYLSRSTKNNSSPPLLTSPTYLHQTSQFELLTINNDSIIFLGDSLTAEGKWSELFANPKIKNRGIGGDTTVGLLARLDKIIESQPQKIFLMIGVNDIYQGVSANTVYNNYRTILERFTQETPRTQVYIQSILPINKNLVIYPTAANNQQISQLNSQLKQLAAEFSYTYVDIFDSLADEENNLKPIYTHDGIHLNGQGYRPWKEILAEYVNDN